MILFSGDHRLIRAVMSSLLKSLRKAFTKGKKCGIMTFRSDVIAASPSPVIVRCHICLCVLAYRCLDLVTLLPGRGLAVSVGLVMTGRMSRRRGRR